MMRWVILYLKVCIGIHVALHPTVNFFSQSGQAPIADYVPRKGLKRGRADDIATIPLPCVIPTACCDSGAKSDLVNCH